jgi:hypothetical protein
MHRMRHVLDSPRVKRGKEASRALGWMSKNRGRSDHEI